MSRRKQLLDDVDIVKKKNEETENFNISDIRLDEETLYFKYDNGEDEENFVYHITDYPEGYSMLFSGNNSDPKMCSGSLLSIIGNISKEYNAKFGIEDDEDEDDEEGSIGSELEEGDEEDFEDEEDEESWEEDYETEISYKEHPDLTVEVANYNAIFGKGTASTRPMPLLETVDVESELIYRDILDAAVCSAWGVDFKLPIRLRITFSSDYFLDAREEPKVEFFQEKNSKKQFRLRYQLEAITTKFVKENWPTNSKKKIVAEEFEPSSSLRRSGGVKKRSLKKSQEIKAKGKEKGWVERVFGQDDKKKKVEDSEVSQLLDMGFSLELSKQALMMTNSIEEATNLLLTDQESVKDALAGGNEPVRKTKPQTVSRIDELFQKPDKALTSEDTKSNVSSKYGFVVMLANYLRFRMPNLNNFCVICDQPHVFAHGNMLKPAVCARDLCCFSFQQLGVGADAADDIATAAEVVDLLICFATVAAKSPRNTVIFDPYPMVFDPKDPKRMVFNPQSQNFQMLNDVLARFPSVEKMSQAKDFSDMKKQMDKAHQHAFSLLQWIITSNRSHIVKMASDKQIKSMATPHQYLLLSAPPEKEAKFRQLKEKHGSVFAFHGSSIENWHSILRTGLKNASGTKLQVNGAAYGAGIYLSPHAATSFGYSRMYNNSGGQSSGGNRFLNTSNINCIAICEVINHEIRKSGSIWVQPSPDYVVTRFFFVFTGANTGTAQNCQTEEVRFRQEILDAIKAHS